MTPKRKGRKNAGRGEKGDLVQADYRRLAEFRYLLRRFLVFSEKAARLAGITARQQQALLAIKAHSGAQPMTTGALAERLFIHHHSAVGLIDRLASKRLVRRRTGPDDRRQVLITLSASAEDLLRRLTVAHRHELNRLAPLLRSLLAHFDASPRP